MTEFHTRYSTLARAIGTEPEPLPYLFSGGAIHLTKDPLGLLIIERQLLRLLEVVPLGIYNAYFQQWLTSVSDESVANRVNRDAFEDFLDDVREVCPGVPESIAIGLLGFPECIYDAHLFINPEAEFPLAGHFTSYQFKKVVGEFELYKAQILGIELVSE